MIGIQFPGLSPTANRCAMSVSCFISKAILVAEYHEYTAHCFTMKILLVDTQELQSVSGQQLFTQRFTNYSIQQGHTIHTLRFSNQPSPDKNTVHIPFYIADPRVYIYVPSLATYQLTTSTIASVQPDIIYTYCGLSPFDFVLPHLAHRTHIPIAATWHQDVNYSANWMRLVNSAIFRFYAPFCRQVDLLHVFSPALRDFYLQLGVAASRINVIPNGVDATFFSPGASAFAKKHHMTQGVLYMGRLTTIKNLDVLFTSFLSLQLPKSTKLIIMGDGELKASLQRRYADPRIIFTGLITDEEQKRDIIRSCQLFVLPSLWEGMSLALLEAMACGLTAITSDTGNHKPLLRHVGTIIPVAKLKSDLASEMHAYLSDPTFLKRKQRQARSLVQHQYSQATVFTTLLNAFAATISTYRRQTSSSS